MNPKISIGGSILVILGGLLILAVGAIVAYVFGNLLSGFKIGGAGLTSLLILGPVLGLVVIVVGVLALVAPNLNILWGILAIVISIVSLFTTALGGLFLGFLLALIGGILIAVKRAPPPAPMNYPMGAPPPPSGIH